MCNETLINNNFHINFNSILRFGEALFSFHGRRRNTFRIALNVMYKIDSLEETKNVVITIKSNDEKNVLYSVYCQNFRVTGINP